MSQPVSRRRPPAGRAGEGGVGRLWLLGGTLLMSAVALMSFPVYVHHQQGVGDRAAASSVREAVAVLHQCDADNGVYPTTADVVPVSGLNAVLGCAHRPILLTTGTLLTYYASTGMVAAPQTAYIVTGTNTGGSGKVYCYSSMVGGAVVATVTPTTGAYRTTC